MSKILVVAAHPDDELLGVGGTVRRLSDEGNEVYALIMAEGITSRSDKREESDFNELDALKEDSRKACETVGYKDVEFCGLPDNRMDSLDLLDVIKKLTPYIEKYSPEIIFTHHHGDLNIDHRITNEAVLTCTRPMLGEKVRKIYAFETPSSTEWNYNYTEPFTPNVYYDITQTVDFKIKGMDCYKSERREYPHPRSGEALEALAKMRGSQCGFEKAEAFMLLRECI